MDEVHDIPPAEQPYLKEFSVKWLTRLLYTHIAGIAISLISLLPIRDGWTVWLSRAVALFTVLCLFRLAPVRDRYRKAACFRAGMLAITLIHAFLSTRTGLILAASLFSVFAVYQEYRGHGELIQDADPGLARKWYRLFTWQFLFSLLISLATTAVSVILVLLLRDGESVPTTAATAVQVINKVLSLALDTVYLIYLKQTIRLMQAD